MRRPSLPSNENAAGNTGTLLRFAVVGAITTTIDFVFFTTLVAAALAPALANIFSYSCGIAVSYVLNRSWTFRARRSHIQAVKFVAATVTGLLISTGLVAVLATILPPLVAKILSVPVVFGWNYLMSRLWVFRA
jgi:putative flippase GtrA